MKINEKTREIHEELLENQDVSKAVTQLGNQHLARRNSSAIIVRHGEHYENANHQCETIEKRRAVGSFYKATYWAFKAIVFETSYQQHNSKRYQPHHNSLISSRLYVCDCMKVFP